MKAASNNLVPSITTLIRMDHTKVLAIFHRYRVDLPARTREALVNSICVALEIHAQAEEEIFYPALRGLDTAAVEKHGGEHAEMRQIINTLRSMQATDPDYDSMFMRLMRLVIHHVADEETILLPAAERMLQDRLHELGAAMGKRKLQLMAPRTGEIVVNTARAMPASTMIMSAGALLVGSYLLRGLLKDRSDRG